MALNGQNSLLLRQTKENHSSLSDDVLMEFHMHHHTIVVYNQYKLHGISLLTKLWLRMERFIDI